MLQIPEFEDEVFENNLLKYVIWQARFNDLNQLGEGIINEFRRRIENQYTLYSQQQIQQINISADQEVQPSSIVSHRFQTADSNFTITLNPSFLSVETVGYIDFHDFRARIENAIEALEIFPQIDHFTRVGLRYVNECPREEGQGASWQGWVNPEIAPPISITGDESILNYGQQLATAMENGILVHRFGINQPQGGDRQADRLVIDMDYYTEQRVEIANVIPLVNSYNRLLYRVFRWSIGERFLNRMRTPRT